MDKTAKKFDLKKVLLDNGIIVLLMLLVIYVSITEPNFRSFEKHYEPCYQRSTSCYHCTWSQRMSDHERNRPFCRTYGWSFCLPFRYHASESGCTGKVWPDFPQLNVWVVLLICMALCAVFGLINGVVISYLSVPAFIGTLGMQMIVYGIALVVTNNVPIGGYRADYTAVTQGKIGGVFPLLFLYLIIAAVIFWFVFNYTRHGKYMYAIGGNEVAAEVSGVNVKRDKDHHLYDGSLYVCNRRIPSWW